MTLKCYQYIEHTGRTIVIGDVHGCLDEFLQLLDRVGFSDQDLCILCGDFLDRGPKSLSCAEYIFSKENIVSVMGNHEYSVLFHLKEGAETRWSQQHTLIDSNKKRRNRLAEKLAELPAVIETPKVIVAHGRLDPERPLDRQKPKYAAAVGGSAVVIEKDRQGVPLWYRKWYKRQGDKPVCIGHKRYDSIWLVEGSLYALDTGAVRAGYLTALILPENTIIQQRIIHDYHDISQREWQALDNGGGDIQKIGFSEIEKLLQHTTPLSTDLVDRFFDEYHSMKIVKLIKDMRQKIVKRYGEEPGGKAEKRKFLSDLSSRYNRDEIGLIRSSVLNGTDDPYMLLSAHRKWDLAKLKSVLESMKKKS